MKIGLIGAGHIGGTLARLLAEKGYEVALSNLRGPKSLRDMVVELGPNARAATPVEAAAFGDLVVGSIPMGRYRELPVAALGGKVVLDTNNYYPGRDGHFEELDSGRTTSSELLQAHLAGARVVKAFNTNYWHVLRDGARPLGAPDRLGIPIAGDDADAKKMAEALIDDIGFDPVDIGDLKEGRHLQPGSPVYARALSAHEIRWRLGIAGPGA